MVYLVPTLLRGNAYNGLSRSHAPAWECIPISFPRPCVGMHTMVYLVPTLLRGNAYLSRSHAPAWECIPTLTVSCSQAPAWECIPMLTISRTAPAISFPRSCVGMHTYADHISNRPGYLVPTLTVLSFPRSCVGMHTYALSFPRSCVGMHTYADRIFLLSRSQAPCVGMHTYADRISNRPGYLVPTRENISFPRGSMGTRNACKHQSPSRNLHLPKCYLVPTLLRGNAYLR